MAIAEDLVQGELGQLLDILPQRVVDNLRTLENVDEILEVVLDLGRLPEARFPSGDITLDDQDITRSDLDNVVERIGDCGADNRAGIERTLHRISAIRNRRGEVIGITCRVGRAVFGTIKIIEDLAFLKELKRMGTFPFAFSPRRFSVSLFSREVFPFAPPRNLLSSFSWLHRYV